MYSVRVMVSLLARNGMMGLSRWLSLPFVPFPGLDLYGLTADPDRAETVAVVGWDVPSGSFLAELLDCEERGESLSDLIDAYGPGWQLHEPGIEAVPEV
jgi:hypothetical protein